MVSVRTAILRKVGFLTSLLLLATLWGPARSAPVAQARCESPSREAPARPIDLTKWRQQGPKENGIWQVAADGSSVLQKINGNPTFFVSPDILLNTTIKGKFAVETEGDDDYIGFVFGYQSPLAEKGDKDEQFEFLMFDWKALDQSGAKEGFSLARVRGSSFKITGEYPAFWYHADSPQFKVLATDFGQKKGWKTNTKYEFELCYHNDQVKIAIDGKPVFDVKGTFPAGRFGFYNYSQSEVRYEGFTYTAQRLGALTVEAMGEGVAEMLTPLQIELILDASGSMREQKRKVDGRLKIDVAKDVMVQSIESLPNGIEVALRVYGHRIREGQKGDCQDSELVFPFAKIDKPRLIQRVRQIQALGTTPIAYSLQQVAQDFGNAPGEKMVILVTDGKEECGGNPSAAVAELLAKGLKVRVNVVGFALAEEAVKQEMNRVAKLTGGRFFDAKDAKGLRKAIQESLGVPYDVLDPAGTKVGSGLTGQTPIEVPDGIYTVVVAVAGKPVSIPNVRITEKKSTKVELRKEGKEIVSKVIGP